MGSRCSRPSARPSMEPAGNCSRRRRSRPWDMRTSSAAVYTTPRGAAEGGGPVALALAGRRGEGGAEGWALWLLAETAARQEPAAWDRASARYADALALASQLGLRPLVAYCHYGLGQLLRREGHP